MTEPCPRCAAPAGEFCRHLDGKIRRTPCISRMVTAAAIEDDADVIHLDHGRPDQPVPYTPMHDPSEPLRPHDDD